jgi:hypothetical protein
MNKGFACALQPSAPLELIQALEPYLQTTSNGQRFFLSSSVTHGAYFVEFEILRKKNNKKWRMAIPHQYILVIAEVGKASPLGFQQE